MKKILLVIFFVLFSITAVYATVTRASIRKSPNILWQGTANLSYDPAHNVGLSAIPEQKYTFLNNTTSGPSGIVKDIKTGLIWESEWSATSMNWSTAVAYCKNLNKGGYAVGSWRLPSLDELFTLADYLVYSPAINGGFFVTQPSHYWSSTVIASYNTHAWVINFSTGGGDNLYSKGNIYYVMCVRNDTN